MIANNRHGIGDSLKTSNLRALARGEEDDSVAKAGMGQVAMKCDDNIGRAGIND